MSDTHLPRGTRRLPDECVRILGAADLIVHAGDIVASSFLEELRGLGPPVEAVHGNVDEWELRETLPAERIIELAGARIGVVHDAGARAGREERLVRRFPGCDAVVYGHTHMPQLDRHGSVWILNPGSPTERRRAPRPTMIAVRLSSGALEPELVPLA